MQLEPIIQALRERCPVFSDRVGGAAQFKLLPESTALQVPFAFVIPLDDSPEESRSQNSVRTNLKDSFAVVVALSNLTDEKGQAATSTVHGMRGVLWGALLGWQPGPDYDGIVYDGGHLVQLDRSRLWYQFEFAASMEIGPEDGWQETGLGALPHFDGVDMNVDVIGPIASPLPGPDGRIEFVVPIPKTGDLPT